MNGALERFLRSWPLDPWLIASLVVSAWIYARGWRMLARRDPQRWHRGQLAAFLGGLVAIFLALGSPLEVFASLSLQAHMTQHLLLMLVAPPLVWIAAPLFPMLRGLPIEVRCVWVQPLLRSQRLRTFFSRMTHPLVAGPIFIGVTWLWHAPRGYELALRSDTWHIVEHACFFGASLLFWYPVVRPYPSRPRWSPWLLAPYLILADVQNTVLAAWLTFSSRPIYAYYSEVPQVAGLTPLQDQAGAGVLMWVPGSIAFLVPLAWLGMRLFAKESSPVSARANRQLIGTQFSPLPVLWQARTSCAIAKQSATGPVGAIDALRLPLVGRWLAARATRTSLRVAMFALAVLVMVDGFLGPAASPMNLAGVLPWTHGRGFVVLGLLTLGNVFCVACPFTFSRWLGRRWLPRGLHWPVALRNKWLAVLLIVVALWSYEAFALWDNPRWTAAIVLGLFAAAFIVEGLFQDAAFCKYVCPVGQFNFVQSLVSPWEVQVRDPATCSTCRTKECIRGNDRLPGCELKLFLPRKQGNMDCTFCLDCVRACPHENVGVLAVTPGSTLWQSGFRSGIGHFADRRDLAALVVILTFGALANAGGMVAPVVESLDAIRAGLGEPPWLLAVSIYYALMVVVAPLALIAGATMLSRSWGRLDDTLLNVATRNVYALVPLGFAVWIAHYSFHLFTSYATVIPAAQRFVGDWRFSLLGDPEWRRACCESIPAWLPRFEIILLDLGLLVSLYVAYRLAQTRAATPGRACGAFAPWALLLAMLFAVAVWIVTQPMQMRGTLDLAG